MASISLKDAKRLGLIADADKAKTKPKPLIKRQPAKGGRLPRNALRPGFTVDITIPFDAKPKQRARTSIDKRRIMAAFAQARGNLQSFAALLDKIPYSTMTPADTKAFEQTVEIYGRAAMKGQGPYEGPVHVDVNFTLTGDPDTWPTDVTDPDLDNMEKAIMDALNKVVWKDDRLVVSKTASKVCGRTPSIALQVRAV